MTYKKIQLKDPEGLHARNSVQICMAVRQRDVKVCLRLGEREAAADQILEVMALNADCGDWIEIISEGREETELCIFQNAFSREKSNFQSDLAYHDGAVSGHYDSIISGGV